MRVIYGGQQAFNALMFGMNSAEDQGFFEREISRMSNVGNLISDSMLQTTKNIYEKFNSSEAIQIGKAALNQFRGVFIPNTVRLLNAIEDFQIAGSVMRRYIMANKEVRKLYHKQLCDGFNETYKDSQPGIIGDGHVAYDEVMSGVVQFDEEGWYYKSSSNGFDERGHVLTGLEKAYVLESWATLEEILAKQDRDPTSIWNSSL